MFAYSDNERFKSSFYLKRLTNLVPELNSGAKIFLRFCFLKLHVDYKKDAFLSWQTLKHATKFYFMLLHGGAKIWILFLSGKIIFYEWAQQVSKILFLPPLQVTV